LEKPPAEAASIAQNLSSSADGIAASLPAQLQVRGDFDVSVSGGGNFDAYYMGVSMVFSRVKAVRQHRFTGASAGGMMPYELVLKGESATLQTHLAYGVLTSLYPKHFWNVMAASEQDHHWRLMAEWQTQKYADTLNVLDGNVYVALSCLAPFPKLVIVSNYTAAKDQATHAFMATGTVVEWYNGMLCSDGGAESGKDMTPLFQDGLRPQLIVNLMKTGGPGHMVYKIETQEYANMIRQGQQEAAEFLLTGKVSRDAKAITLCPKGAKVDKNICERAATAAEGEVVQV